MTKNRYIMIVESNRNDLLYMSALIENFQYSVCTAQTAKEALVMADLVLPALIIVEMNLSDMSGLDFVRLIKQHKKAMSVPVIMKSSDPSSKTENLSQAIGCTAHLHNSIRIETLYSTIQASLERTPRKKIRLNVQLCVSLWSMSFGRLNSIYCSVLSEQGMYIKMTPPCQKDEIIHLEFTLNGRDISTDAIVLYSHKYVSGSFNDPGMGVRFTNLPQDDQMAISQYIRNHLLRGIDPRWHTN
jgi:two-component system, cell cycle response regulator DivK